MAKSKQAKLKIISLGGLNEIGKNLTVFEYGEDIIAVDCGLAFPDDDMLGIDLVIPDISYLEKNAEKVRGIFLTHGHEDHIGALPYVLPKVNVPLYGTNLTLGIIRNKLEEHNLVRKTIFNVIQAGDKVKAGCFSIEFIRVNHSIADSVAMAITTPVGVVIVTGDFKIDLTPISGQMINLTRFGELGKEGVMLLMSDSTNAERQGFTPSERKVAGSMESIFAKYAKNRITIATFSSNVHRVQTIINTSVAFKRKVAVSGRSMLNILSVAMELGYINVPDGVLIDINDIKRFTPDKITLITTGSQGEHMSALYRMAISGHDKVQLGSDDVVVLSANAIPGNEKLVSRIVNELSRKGVNVVNDAIAEVHVSGHACQEELKMILGLVQPKYFMPMHGEYRHLRKHAELAEQMGVPKENIIISDVGKILEINQSSARINGTVTSGKVLVDGSGVGDVGNIVLRDRKLLAQDGLIVVVVAVDTDERLVMSGPDIVSRGFVYVRENEELMDQARKIVKESIEELLDEGVTEWNELKGHVRDNVSKFFYAKTKRRPMILPVIMEV